MSTKSKARQARRHPEETTTESSPQSLPAEQKKAAGDLMGAVLNLVTLGAVEPEPQSKQA